MMVSPVIGEVDDRHARKSGDRNTKCLAQHRHRACHGVPDGLGCNLPAGWSGVFMGQLPSPAPPRAAVLRTLRI